MDYKYFSMAEEKFDKKKVEEGIANVAAVIKSIVKNKKSIVNATKDFAEIIKIMAAVSKALDSPEAKKAITVSGDISKTLGGIVNAITAMTKPINTINSVNRRGLWKAKIKVRSILNTIKSIIATIAKKLDSIANDKHIKKTIANAKKQMADIESIIENVYMVIAMVSDMEVKKSFKRKVKQIIRALDYVDWLLETVSFVANRPNLKKTAKDVKHIASAVESVSAIFVCIKKTPTRGIKRKSKSIIKSLETVNELMQKIVEVANKGNTKSAEKKMKQIHGVFSTFRNILISIMLLAPIALLFLAISPILIICLGGAAIVLRLLMFVLTKVLGPRTLIRAVITIPILVMVMLGMVILALALLALGLIAVPTLKLFPMILLFFLGLVAFVILLAGFGLVVGLAWELMVVGILGIALITVAVLCIVLMALMLWVLQELELDADKIKANVKKVLATAAQIILWVAEPISDEENPYAQTDEHPDPSLADMISNGISKLLMALIGMVTLVLLFVAVLAVVLMALLLRLIQTLDLDRDKIEENVKMVFDIARGIIDLVNSPIPDHETGGEDRNDAVSRLCAWIYPPLGKVIDALAGALYMIFLLFGVLAVLLMATMLRLLQNLNLDGNKIRQNVEMVFDIAKGIIDIIYGDDEQSQGKSRWGGIIGLLCDLVYPPLGKIIDALVGAVYLILMLIGVLAVMLIATMLRLLQNLDLKEDRIYQNVQTVFGICEHIINIVFGQDDANDQGSTRNPILAFIRWCADAVGLGGLMRVIEAVFAIAYLVLMLIAILCVLGIAKLLEIIQDLALNEEKIMTNVKIVFSASQHIIDYVFGKDDANDEKSGRTPIIDFICWCADQIGLGALVRIIQAIFAIAYLALVIVAVLCVLGIAELLKQIEEIDLNADKVHEQVGIVMQTSQYIIDCVFGRDDANSDESGRKGIIDFLKWIADKLTFGLFSGLSRIIEAIFTIAYLGLMIVAIMCVLALAEMLKLLQDMELNSDAVMENVSLVMTTAKYIVDMVYRPDEANKDASSRNGILDFIKWVADHVPLCAILTGISKILEVIFTIAYLGLMIVAIMIVMALAQMLVQLSLIKQEDINKGVENAKAVMRGSNAIVQAVFNADDEETEESDDGGILKFLKWVFKVTGLSTLASIIQAIFTIGFLVIAFIAIAVVLGLAHVMQKLAKIKPEEIEKAKENARVVMRATKAIANIVFDEEKFEFPETDDDLLSGIIGLFLGSQAKEAMKAAKKIETLQFMYGAIAVVGNLAECMAKMGRINISEIENSKSVARDVMSAIKYIAKKVFQWQLNDGDDEGKIDIDKVKSNAGILQTLTTAIDALAALATELKRLENVQLTQQELVESVANCVMGSAKTIMRILNDENGLTKELIESVINKLHSLEPGVQRMVDAVIAFAKKFAELVNLPLKDLNKALQNTKSVFATIAMMLNAASMKNIFGSSGVGGNSIFSKLNEDFTLMFIDDVGQFNKRLNLTMSAIDRIIILIQKMMVLMNIVDPALSKLNSMANSGDINGAKLGQKISIIFTTMSNLIHGLYTSIVGDNQQSGAAKALQKLGISVGGNGGALGAEQLRNMIDLMYIQGTVYTTATGLIAHMIKMVQRMYELGYVLPMLNSLEVPQLVIARIPAVFAAMHGIVRRVVNATLFDTGWESLIKRGQDATEAVDLAINVLNRYIQMIPLVQQIGTGLESIQIDENVIAANAEKSLQALHYMFRIIRAASVQVNGDRVYQNMALMDRINESITSFTHVTAQDVKNNKDLTDNYIDFLTKVNSMDMAKLKTTEQLMKHWADMSISINGNFQGLARAINEYIAPVLEDLNKTMGESVKVQKQIIEDLQKPIEVSQLAGGGNVGTPTDSGSTDNSGGQPTSSGGNPTSAPPTAGTGSTQTGQAGDGADLNEDDMRVIPENGEVVKERKAQSIPTEYAEEEGPSFLWPYGGTHKRGPGNKSAIDRCIDGDALRVKIVN